MRGNGGAGSPVTTVGETIGGKYRLDRLLGEGGMGAVYAAENLNTGRRVAVKVLHGEWTQRPEIVQRFLREARATTTIAHPNVVEVLDLDVDRERGIPYIVQEFLEGETLEGYLAARPGRRVDPAEALTILMPVMEALVAAHACGIVHRDLKPANLFLSRSRSGEMVPKVIDFGIAKHVDAVEGSASRTQAGTAIGTPSYMSPEQVAGLTDIDAQTDVWSLGIVLFEMLTGRLPFESPNLNVLMAKILYEAPTPISEHRADLPADLQQIVASALHRERPARLASMRAMLLASLECSAYPKGASGVRPSWDDAPSRVSTPPAGSASAPSVLLSSPPIPPTATAAMPSPHATLPASPPVIAPTPGAPSRARWVIVSVSVIALGLVAAVALSSARGAAPSPNAPLAASPQTPAAPAAALAPSRAPSAPTVDQPLPRPVAAAALPSTVPAVAPPPAPPTPEASRRYRPVTPTAARRVTAPRTPPSVVRALQADEI